MGTARQKRRAVLIVEDDAELRSLTAALLEDEQLDTIECESAEAALAIMLMREHEVTVVFADVRLPGAMDGIDLTWEVTCARVASGHVATPPSSVMNSRRPMSDIGLPPPWSDR